MTTEDDGWTPGTRSLGGELLVAQRQFSALFHERMDVAGFTDVRPGAGNAFEHIAPGGSTVAVMAQRAGISPQAMVQIIDDLEHKGYVERAPSPTDRRAKLVKLTSRGRRMLATAAGILRDIEADYAARLGAKRYAELRRMLGEIVDLP